MLGYTRPIRGCSSRGTADPFWGRGWRASDSEAKSCRLVLSPGHRRKDKAWLQYMRRRGFAQLSRGSTKHRTRLRYATTTTVDLYGAPHGHYQTLHNGGRTAILRRNQSSSPQDSNYLVLVTFQLFL